MGTRVRCTGPMHGRDVRGNIEAKTEDGKPLARRSEFLTAYKGANFYSHGWLAELCVCECVYVCVKRNTALEVHMSEGFRIPL